MKKFWRRLADAIPVYAVLPLIFCFTVNCIVYWGTGLIAGPLKHYDFTLAFDEMVPLVPGFITVYLGCYLFWVINYVLIGAQGKEHCLRFVSADLMSRLICGLFYLVLPTTNVRPELVGGDLWTQLLGFIYAIDKPLNLFPSIHCVVSWFCFIGIRGRKNVPKAYRILSCVLAILVFVSTQVTKQHYIVDVVGAVAIVELTYFIGFHTSLYRGLAGFFDKITGKVFGRTYFDSLHEENDGKSRALDA